MEIRIYLSNNVKRALRSQIDLLVCDLTTFWGIYAWWDNR